MSLSFFDSILRPLTSRWPLLLYAAAWTALLSATVAVASFLPEAAFVWAISPSSSFSRGCDAEGFIRVPMDLPGRFCVCRLICLPSLAWIYWCLQFLRLLLWLVLHVWFEPWACGRTTCLVESAPDSDAKIRKSFPCVWLKPGVVLCVGTDGVFESITVLICKQSLF
ncbi:hypothetical protein AAG906_036765 [Vitis piasezkii]